MERRDVEARAATEVEAAADSVPDQPPAGIQADLKAFAAAGCHGMSAIVALTAQNTVGVTDVHEAPTRFVRAQLEAVFSDIGVDAAKTGMLFSAPIIETVAEFLAGYPIP